MKNSIVYRESGEILSLEVLRNRWKLNEDLEKFSNGMKLKTAEDLRILKALTKDRKITAKAEKNLNTRFLM